MRILISIGLSFLLLLSVLLLFGGGHSLPTVHAQDVDGTNARQLFLPLIQRPAPLPTPPPIKAKSGIHLGNRGSDWRAALFTLITGTTGTWPAAVVVQSNQLYTFNRPTTATTDNEKCWITDAEVKRTATGDRYNAFAYLTAAVDNGVKVVFRLSPSPGNFLDEVDSPTLKHTLLITATPNNGDYCNHNGNEGSFRDIQDLAHEMDAIYRINVAHGWYTDTFFFEPANEPNLEWYVHKRPGADTGLRLSPDITAKEAWIAMDNYFAALYDLLKGTTAIPGLNPHVQLLTPPMSQEQYAEHYLFNSCTPRWVNSEEKVSGLDYMKQTFGIDFENPMDIRGPKADGFSWHNYFNLGQEGWQAPYLLPGAAAVIDDYCKANNQNFNTGHVSQYVSADFQTQLTNSLVPTFITEADRKSPCQNGYEGSAEGELGKLANANEMRDSLLHFIAAEEIADYVIVWLLTNQYASEDSVCTTVLANGDRRTNANYEQNWHEAYDEVGGARTWFQRWWPVAQ